MFESFIYCMSILKIPISCLQAPWCSHRWSVSLVWCVSWHGSLAFDYVSHKRFFYFWTQRNQHRSFHRHHKDLLLAQQGSMFSWCTRCSVPFLVCRVAPVSAVTPCMTGIEPCVRHPHACRCRGHPDDTWHSTESLLVFHTEPGWLHYLHIHFL